MHAALNGGAETHQQNHQETREGSWRKIHFTCTNGKEEAGISIRAV